MKNNDILVINDSNYKQYKNVDIFHTSVYLNLSMKCHFYHLTTINGGLSIQSGDIVCDKLVFVRDTISLHSKSVLTCSQLSEAKDIYIFNSSLLIASSLKQINNWLDINNKSKFICNFPGVEKIKNINLYENCCLNAPDLIYVNILSSKKGSLLICHDDIKIETIMGGNEMGFLMNNKIVKSFNKKYFEKK